MKFLSFVFVLIFSTNVLASSVNEALNQHRYFATVEWNQHDQASINAANAILINQLSKFSKADLEAWLVSEVHPADLAIMKERLTLALKNGDQDLSTLLQEISSASFSQGASWNGVTTGLMVVGGVALSAFVLYTWFIHNQLECDGFYDCHGGE